MLIRSEMNNYIILTSTITGRRGKPGKMITTSEPEALGLCQIVAVVPAYTRDSMVYNDLARSIRSHS